VNPHVRYVDIHCNGRFVERIESSSELACEELLTGLHIPLASLFAFLDEPN
jgi:hypothetical protein